MAESKDEVRQLEEGLCTGTQKSPTSSSYASNAFTEKSQQPLLTNESQDDGRHDAWRRVYSSFLAFLCRRKPRTIANGVIVRQLDSSPKGYPHLAAFLDSDESFMVYRRFGYLGSRLLLEKQDHLQRLERRLDRLDQCDGRDDPEKLSRTNLSGEDAAPRRELFAQIDKNFREYASLLVAAQQLVSFNKPAACDYQSVISYMNETGPLPAKEAEWVRHREDIITLRCGREHAWLDSGIEHVLKFLQHRLGVKTVVEYFFCSAETKQKCQGSGVYYDRDRITRVANGIIIFTILTLLVVPIYVLYHLVADVGTSRSYAICIGVLLVSTLAFSAVLSLFTRARRHEILGAAAAYCAVLVVFFGNVSHNLPGGN